MPRDWYRVPVQRGVECTPLTLETIRSRAPARATEVKPPKSLPTGSPDRFPVQEHVGAQGEVLFQTRRPRNRDDVFERERNQPSDRRSILPDQSDSGALPERRQYSRQKFRRVYGGSEVVHPHGEHLVKRRQVFGSAELDRES